MKKWLRCNWERGVLVFLVLMVLAVLNRGFGGWDGWRVGLGSVGKLDRVNGLPVAHAADSKLWSWEGSDTTNKLIYSTVYGGMSFMTAGRVSLGSVEVYGTKTGTFTTLFGAIYDTDVATRLPTGSPLQSGSILGSSVSGGVAWYTITMTTRPGLQGNHEYALVLYTDDGNGTNCFNWRYSGARPLATDYVWGESLNYSGAWTTNVNGYVMKFRVNGLEATSGKGVKVFGITANARNARITSYTSELAWNTAVTDGAPTGITSNLSTMGFYEYLTSDLWIAALGSVGFTVPVWSSWTVTGAEVDFMWTGGGSPYTNAQSWEERYYALYKVAYTGDNPTALQFTNTFKQYGAAGRVSYYVDGSQAVNGRWFSIPLDPAKLTWLNPDAGGYVWFTLANSNHMQNLIPVKKGTGWNALAFDPYAVGYQSYPPRLVVYYDMPMVGATADRTVTKVSDGALAAPDGAGVVSSVLWETPRTAYNDDDLGAGMVGFDVAGGEGTPLKLELVDDGGTVRASSVDSIRVGGHKHWYPLIPSGYVGYMRARVTQSTTLVVTTGTWGYSAAAPDVGEAVNYAYAVDTKDGSQWSYPFKTFMVSFGGVNVAHWKLNIDYATELGDTEFRLLRNGVTEWYGNNLNSMASSYFQNTGNNNLLPWRYALFTVGASSGFDDKDGLILNLGKSNSAANYGFIEPQMYSIGGSAAVSLAKSAFWWVNGEADGISLVLGAGTAQIVGGLMVGSGSGVVSNLNQLAVWYVPVSYGNTTEATTGVVVGAATRLVTDLPMDGNQYYYEVKLSYPTAHDFVYVFMTPFMAAGAASPPGTTVGGGTFGTVNLGPGGWNWIGKAGTAMDNLGFGGTGRYILLLLLMGVAFFFLRNETTLRVLVPLLIFGAGLVTGWVDAWVVVLLAGVFGVGVWKWISGNRQKGSEG